MLGSFVCIQIFKSIKPFVALSIGRGTTKPKNQPFGAIDTRTNNNYVVGTPLVVLQQNFFEFSSKHNCRHMQGMVETMTRITSKVKEQSLEQKYSLIGNKFKANVREFLKAEQKFCRKSKVKTFKKFFVRASIIEGRGKSGKFRACRRWYQQNSHR